MTTNSAGSFRENLAEEAKAATESQLMMEYIQLLHTRIGHEKQELSAVSRNSLARAQEVATLHNPLEKRVNSLMATSEDESYYGNFGRPLIQRHR